MDGEKIYSSRLGDGVSFQYILENKFKTSCISVHFVTPMDRQNVTINAVLAELLRRSCGRYSKFTELQRRLAMLYGACVSASVGSIGNCQMITLEISMIDDRFVPDTSGISNECAELLCDMIFRPAREVDGSLFRREDVEISLRITQERIKSVINDKGEYAVHRCLAEMCADEPFGVEAGGYEEDLPGITRERLEQAWKKLLGTAAVNIIMVGTADHQAVENRFTQEFGKISRTYLPLPRVHIVGRAENCREVVERMDVQQCKMVIGMRIPVAEPVNDTMAARLMSMLYGGGVTSLLFNNVREKLSLCYYCSSSYMRKCGIILVSSGLKESNYATAVDEIKRQLEVIANNKFTDREFEAIKLSAVSGLDEIRDSIYSIERWYASQFLDGSVSTPEQTAERLLAVTRREVAECAARVMFDTIYLLAPKNIDECRISEGGGGQ